MTRRNEVPTVALLAALVISLIGMIVLLFTNTNEAGPRLAAKPAMVCAPGTAQARAVSSYDADISCVSRPWTRFKCGVGYHAVVQLHRNGEIRARCAGGQLTPRIEHR